MESCKEENNEPSLKNLSSRLHRLERENRWLKVGFFAILAIFLFVGAKEKEIFDVIQAKKIIVKDEHGEAVLTGSFLHFPMHSEKDFLGSYYGRLGLEVRGGAKNHTLVFLGEKISDMKPVPALRMFSEDGKSMAFLTMNHNGESSLLFRTNMMERVVLGETELKDTKTGSTIIRPSTSLVFIDEKGKVVWSAP